MVKIMRNYIGEQTKLIIESYLSMLNLPLKGLSFFKINTIYIRLWVFVLLSRSNCKYFVEHERSILQIRLKGRENRDQLKFAVEAYLHDGGICVLY